MDHETFYVEPELNDSVAVDRTVTFLFVGLGVILGFLLIMSTFLQVNRFTAKPSQISPAASGQSQPEIGG